MRGQQRASRPITAPVHILIDSRKLIFPGSTIFFALHQKGSSYIKSLYEKNVRFFVISDPAFDTDLYKEAVFLLVDDVLESLQALAIHHRNRFALPVIGITGSNGKTIVKEWLYHLLLIDHTIIRSPKSYNSQIGVPLSVLPTAAEHTLAIFEAGISQPGEMVKLEKMIRPGMGVFTKIGEPHSEGFISKGQKIKEKLTLFRNSEVLVSCIEDEDLYAEIKDLQLHNKALQLFTWSRKGKASLAIRSIEKHENSVTIHGFYDRDIHITIPFTDDASVENAITCWCMLLHMKIGDKVIAERMLTLEPVEMRLQLKHGINNCDIINDSYSADINSLQIALDFLHQQKRHQKKTVILSDILQSSQPDDELYRDVASLLQQKNIQRLIAVGPNIYLHRQNFDFIPDKYFFHSADECISYFPGAARQPGESSLQFKDEIILLKGARIFHFENIDRLLEEKVHKTLLSIDLTAIAHNCKVYQAMVKPSVKMMAMVKASGYGIGSYEIANLLQFININYLSVAYADEGVELRKGGITMPVMVMNPDERSFGLLADYSLEPEIYSFSLLSSLEKYLQTSGLQFFPVHIKLDTGMHRLGFEAGDMNALSERILHNNAFKVQSVFSHLAASDDKKADDFTRKQAAVFIECCEKLQDVIPYKFTRHIANTSAISRFPDLQLDMVRLGIGMYGFDSNQAIQKKLKNVTTLTTTVAQVKKVKAGDHVGYGCNIVLASDSVIATVRIGYADGYPRFLSNGRGKMVIHNRLVPVVGNVCMDMTMLDVTGIYCKEGDTVIVFGEQLPLQQLADWCHTIPYEIMTGVSQRVRRVYFE